MTPVELGETCPSAGTASRGSAGRRRRAGPTARDEETNVGRWGGCGARPGGLRRMLSGMASALAEAPSRRRPRRRPARRCRSRSPPRSRRRAGAGRGARHRDADRQRRGQDARRQRDHRGPFRATARRVKQGDLLFTLDGRAIEAQIKQVEGVHRRRQGAARAGRARRRALHRAGRQERHHRSSRSTTPRPRSTSSRAAVKSNKAALENLKVQLELLPRSARRSPAASAWPRQGRQFRAAGRPDAARDHHPDRAGLRHLPVPQRSLPDCARRSPAETATIEAIVPGDDARAERPGHDDREHGRSGDRHGDRCAPPCRTRTSCCGPARW